MGFVGKNSSFGDKQMKTLTLFLLCLTATSVLPAQVPLSQDEALKQIYIQYDAEKKIAQWDCAKDEWRYEWPCTEKDKTVSVSVLLMSQVVEDGTKIIYLATSVKPNDDSWHGFVCHLCRPKIGVGVFAWQAQHWVLQSANAAVGEFSGSGYSPGGKLVQIGPEKHGLLLSAQDLTHGHFVSYNVLLLPLDRNVAKVWSVSVEQNDGEDTQNYESKATFKFFTARDASSRDYYDIEVISTGNYRDKYDQPLKPENWTETYRFKDGEYKLLSHKDLSQ
jgi:hypothetical protein